MDPKKRLTFPFLSRGPVKNYAGSVELAVSLILLVYIYRWPIGNIADVWRSDEYSYGYFVPVLAVLIGLHRLSRFRPLVGPSWSGVGLFVVGLLFFAAGMVSSSRHLVFFGLWLSLISLSLAHFGIRATVILAPAFIYLLFALPLPTELYNKLSLEMQLLSSSIGVSILDLMGVTVFQNGNIIDFGPYQLQVAEACNGLRYLFPLMSLGFLVGYLLKDRWWKRIVVFFSTIPITIGMNALRIASAGIAVNYWGRGAAEGLVHEFHGFVVFAICLVVLLVEVKVLLYVGAGGFFDWRVFTLPRGPFFAGPLAPWAPAGTLLCLLLALSIFGASTATTPRSPFVPAHQSLALFPSALDAWRGKYREIDSEVLKTLNLTDYVQMEYRLSEAAAPVDLYLAYYAAQKLGAGIHSPTNCLPGSGWKIDSEKKVSFAPDQRMPPNAIRLVIRSGEYRQMVYYWFEQQGQNVTSQAMGRWLLLVDSVFRNRRDGALIRLMTPILPTETEAEAENRLRSFLSLAFPTIRVFLPKE